MAGGRAKDCICDCLIAFRITLTKDTICGGKIRGLARSELRARLSCEPPGCQVMVEMHVQAGERSSGGWREGGERRAEQRVISDQISAIRRQEKSDQRPATSYQEARERTGLKTGHYGKRVISDQISAIREQGKSRSVAVLPPSAGRRAGLTSYAPLVLRSERLRRTGFWFALCSKSAGGAADASPTREGWGAWKKECAAP